VYCGAQNGRPPERRRAPVTLDHGIVQYGMLLKDHRDVDGCDLPFTAERRAPGRTMILKFTEIENNAPLAVAAVAKPDQ
jgi:hypothetical protein